MLLFSAGRITSWKDPGVQVTGSFCPSAAGPRPLQQSPGVAARGSPKASNACHGNGCPTPALLLPGHQLLIRNRHVSSAATFSLASLASHDGLPKAPDPRAT